MEYNCIVADRNLIIKKFDFEIKKHHNSKMWKEFKQIALDNLDTRIVYMGILDNQIITEATAIISNKDLNIQNKEDLVSKDTAYLTAFRTNKEYEGKGYFSKLYKFLENNLKNLDFKTLTLGVEPTEIRNKEIYFHFGFTKYLKTSYETYPNGQKILVEYYKKEI